VNTCGIERGCEKMRIAMCKSIGGNQYHGDPKDNVEQTAEAISAFSLFDWPTRKFLLQTLALILRILFSIRISSFYEFVIHRSK
jgi:hypothetical protein